MEDTTRGSSAIIRSPIKSPPEPHTPKVFKVKGTEVTIWTDLVLSFMPEVMNVLLKDSAQIVRARAGITDYLNKRLPALGLSLSGIKVAKRLTIPKVLEREFKGWFKQNYENSFNDFAMESPSSSVAAPKPSKSPQQVSGTKRKSEETTPQRSSQRSKKDEGAVKDSTSISRSATLPEAKQMTRYNMQVAFILTH